MSIKHGLSMPTQLVGTYVCSLWVRRAFKIYSTLYVKEKIKKKKNVIIAYGSISYS